MPDSSQEQVEELERFVSSIIHKLSSLTFRVQGWVDNLRKAFDARDDDALRSHIESLQRESDTIWTWWADLRDEYYKGMEDRENMDESNEELVKLDHLATEAFLLTYIPPRALQHWTPELGIAYQTENDILMNQSINALQGNVDKAKRALDWIRDEYASMRDG